jgi:hypothetical protein
VHALVDAMKEHDCRITDLDIWGSRYRCIAIGIQPPLIPFIGKGESLAGECGSLLKFYIHRFFMKQVFQTS